LVENAHGKGAEIFNSTKQLLQESKVSDIKTEMVKVVGGGFFKIREFDYLMVTNESLKDFRMYVGARDYGNDLNISWYLTCEPGPLKKLFSDLIEKNPMALSLSLNVFNYEELNAYTTKVHHCVLKAVESLMMNLGQDFSKIERKSKGFLGVS